MVQQAKSKQQQERGSTPALEARGLRKTFGDMVAVDDVSFHIAPGETYGLLGPNGAGKTTAIGMICGLLERDAGEVLIDGQQLTTGSVSVKSAIGYVPQELAVYPDLSARENLTFFARLYGMSGRDAKVRIDEVMETIGLADRSKDMVKTFSGGMQRRLNIGIGLLHRPKLLILDEPTVGVDPQSRNSILENVESLSDEGMAVLYTTHYMEEAERLCDRVGIIDSGQLRAEGTRRELVALVGEHDRVEIAASSGVAAGAEAARKLDRVQEASTSDSAISIIMDDARTALPELLATLVEAGVTIRSIDVREPDLEAVFLHLTGRALRD